jgi:hypothetical protein
MKLLALVAVTIRFSRSTLKAGLTAEAVLSDARRFAVAMFVTPIRFRFELRLFAAMCES